MHYQVGGSLTTDAPSYVERRADAEFAQALGRGHESALHGVAVSPDGQSIASAGRDRKLMLWNLPEILAQDEVTAACVWVGDYLQHNPTVADEDRNLCDSVLPSPESSRLSLFCICLLLP